MPLAPGTKLGPYEILTPLGTGGMGEVYRARDTRLGRDVAVKVLPEAFAKDQDRLRRFETEARTIATLNHPNILSIHDVGSSSGAPFLVSELLEGQTLREEMNAGALPVRRAVEYATAIAQGLAVAHEHGIIHRDLKPENIFVTQDGRLKILDFGLAKLAGGETTDASITIGAFTSTNPGIVLGTVGYMSPEQVRGEPADARSDIFSLGAILYEMLSGQRAFRRNTSAETMTAILKEEPPEFDAASRPIMPELDRVVRRCLEKRPLERFQSARDLGFNLSGISGSTTASKAQKATRGRQLWWKWITVGLLVLTVAGGAWLAGRRSVSSRALKFQRLTYQRGYPSGARFAKDGNTIVYSAQWNNDPMQIFSVRAEYPQSVKVDLPVARLLSLSGNGDVQLAVDLVGHSNFASGTLAQSRMEGGAPRSLEKGVIAADFAPDGKSVALSRIGTGKVQVEYPAGKVVFETNGYADYVRVSRNGKEVAFLEHPVYDDDRGWVSVIDGSGAYRKLTEEFPATQGLAWTPDGKEIWFTAGLAGGGVGASMQLYGVSLDGRYREIYATPERIRLLDIAQDGRVLLSSERFHQELSAVEPKTGKEHTGLEWFNGSSVGDIAPDGKSIVMEEWGGPAGPLYEVAYRKLDGSAPVDLGNGSSPHFSPDGTTVAALLYSRPPQVGLYPIGTGEGRRLTLGDIVSVGDFSWFPNGKHLLLQAATAAGQPLRGYRIATDGSGRPEQWGPPEWVGMAVSRDGSRGAGRKSTGEPAVFDERTNTLQTIAGILPDEEILRWTEDGEGLLVNSATAGEERVYRVEIANGKRTLMDEVKLKDMAGSVSTLKLLVLENPRMYVYRVRRILGSLYVVDGLR